MSITMINDKETKLCAENLTCKALTQYAQLVNKSVCMNQCLDNQFYYEQQYGENECRDSCDNNYYYIYNESMTKCTQNSNCSSARDSSNNSLPYLDSNNYCVEKCTTELYYQYNSNIKKCSTNDHCDETTEDGTNLTYVNANGQCLENCTNFQFVYNDKFTNCTGTCDNIKIQNGTALPYGDQESKLCVEKCEYHWFYKSTQSDKQCTNDSSCLSAKNQQYVTYRFLDAENDQCIQTCPTQYTFNYYTDDDTGMSNLYACSKYNDTCNESMAFNGTEMKYLMNPQTDTCIDSCSYTWWYQKLNTTLKVCVDENNTKCVNLNVDGYDYTSGNAEDHQCIILRECKQSNHSYIIKDDQCFYYKSINKCQQFSEIEEYSTYIVQSTEDYRCVEDCNEDDYFYLSESENNQKICVESCSELSSEYKVSDNSRECVKSSKSDDNKSNTGLIVGVTIAAIVLVAIIVGAVIFVLKKKNQKQNQQNENGQQQMTRNTQNIYI